MEIQTRHAALCLIQRGDRFLISEMIDPHTGAALRRPPGGGMEPGETPEQAVRRELREELDIDIGELQSLGPVDHVWFWKGREIHERAWLFLGNSSCDGRLARGDTPDIIEPDGDHFTTVWLTLAEAAAGPPKLCPPLPKEVLGAS